VEGLKIEFILIDKIMSVRIYQQRIVFIECVQVAAVGDSNLICEGRFVSLLKKQLVPTTTK
jgi:hypothetical protein